MRVRPQRRAEAARTCLVKRKVGGLKQEPRRGDVFAELGYALRSFEFETFEKGGVEGVGSAELISVAATALRLDRAKSPASACRTDAGMAKARSAILTRSGERRRITIV